MILELDLGNTRAKWRILTDRSEVAAQGVVDIADWRDGPFPDVWCSGIARVRIASVLASTTESDLIAKIQTDLSLSAELARSTSSCCGVVNAYLNPERLGVDRWLALIAAYQLCGAAVMVVDVGTALKVDAVDDAGRHIGGYIIPGAMLMERALLEGTDRVRYEGGQSFESVALGQDTRSCVQNGIAAALVGAVAVAIEQCSVAIGRRPVLYLTGGGGSLLKRHLHDAGMLDLRFESDLVLDGLRWALP